MKTPRDESGQIKLQLFKDEEGQTLVITALCMTTLLGCLALAIDVGMLFNARRQLQIDADAAATAAAVQYVYGYTPSTTANTYSTANAITAGQTAATTNDPNINTPVAVTVNANAASPAAHKVCSGSTCFFEAIVTKSVNTVFFGAFYNMFTNTTVGTTVTVGARAVAGTTGGTSADCAYLTDATGLAITANGKWDVVASTCGLYINSNNSTVGSVNGAAGGITAASISMVGVPSGSDGLSIKNSVVPQQVLPEPIPFSNITPPPLTGCVPWANQTTPGCYTMPTGKKANDTVSGALSAGLYIFSGNVQLSSVTGTGICLDINDGSLEVVAGNNTSGFTPPTTGEFSNIAIYMPPTNNSTIILDKGASGFNSAGWIDAPGATFSMQDNGSSTTVGGLIVDNINTGPSTVTITGSAGPSSPIKAVSLVE